MKLLDQTKEYYLRNSCTIVSLLHIMMFNFGISVVPSFYMKVAIFFDQDKKRFPKFGAYFSVIYNAFVFQLNRKLKLKFKVEKRYISKFNGDTRSWGIGVKNYNQIWKDAEKKGELTLEDVEKMKTYTGKTYFHNLIWDGSKGGYIINSAGNKPFKCKLKVLKALQRNGFTYDPMRTIKPVDNFTILVTQITMQMRRYERRGNLEEYITKTIPNEAFEKAWELYKYGRDDLKIYN